MTTQETEEQVRQAASEAGRSSIATAGDQALGPRLGGIIGTYKWIGGPPNEDFTGPAYAGPSTPLCYRNLDTSSEIKGFVKRTEGCSTKFK